MGLGVNFDPYHTYGIYSTVQQRRHAPLIFIRYWRSYNNVGAGHRGYFCWPWRSRDLCGFGRYLRRTEGTKGETICEHKRRDWNKSATYRRSDPWDLRRHWNVIILSLIDPLFSLWIFALDATFLRIDCCFIVALSVSRSVQLFQSKARPTTSPAQHLATDIVVCTNLHSVAFWFY